MKLTAGIVIILLLIHNHICGQKSLTKEEIIRYWNRTTNKRHEDPTDIVNSSATLNSYLVKLVDSLRSNKIDSVIILSMAYPGYYGKKQCDTSIFPITTFVIYRQFCRTYIKKLKGYCLFEVFEFTSLHLFDFYGKNKKQLQFETFMPVIFSAKINKDSIISYSANWIDHEPYYSFYYSIGTDSRSYQFCESFIENKKSLFHHYNSNLAAFHWWRLIKPETDKLN